MVQYREDTQGKIRSGPVNSKLKELLISAGEEAGVDLIRVTSGGQCKLGVCSKRTGSTRHDDGNAADLELWVNGKAVDFSTMEGQQCFEAFARFCARRGATGIGAAREYMGTKTIHVGFGKPSIWGARGSSAFAPEWLVASVKDGWGAQGSGEETLILAADEVEECDEGNHESNFV